MPSREDEYYAGLKEPGLKEPRGQPLCPFCGKPYVYPIKTKRLFLFTKTLGWSCANEDCRMYRKQFPAPSWGPGKKRK